MREVNAPHLRGLARRVRRPMGKHYKVADVRLASELRASSST